MFPAGGHPSESASSSSSMAGSGMPPVSADSAGQGLKRGSGSGAPCRARQLRISWNYATKVSTFDGLLRLTEDSILIRRGFSTSGISRFRSMCSMPSS